MCGGEADPGEAIIGKKYTVDKSDPAKRKSKRGKKKASRRAGAGADDDQPQGFEDDEGRPDNDHDFAYDPELELGFPEEQREFQSKPCLEGVEDIYTEKANVKKRDKSGAHGAFSGDADFGAPETADE